MQMEDLFLPHFQSSGETRSRRTDAALGIRCSTADALGQFTGRACKLAADHRPVNEQLKGWARGSFCRPLSLADWHLCAWQLKANRECDGPCHAPCRCCGLHQHCNLGWADLQPRVSGYYISWKMCLAVHVPNNPAADITEAL